MKTGKEYMEALKQIHPRIYYKGEPIECVVGHPLIQPHINAVAMTYDMACDPEFEDLCTATSHLTGEKISRFTHIHQSTDDLIKKVKMLRAISQRTGSCYQRCVGFDALNATYSVTNEDGSLTQRGETIIAHTPAGRFAEPEELLGTIHYLISDASSFVTGVLSVVDGGFDAFSI